MYQSQCLVESVERETKGKFWKSWSKPRGMWHCFNG